MKSRLVLFATILFMAAVQTAMAFDPPLEKGKQIFSIRCAACHNVNKQLTGPALSGVDERRSISWIIKFVQSSQSLIRSGDKDATALFDRFNKIPMPDHPDLTEDDIKSIVEYIKSEAKPAAATKAPFAKPGKLQPGYLPLSIKKDYGFFLGYMAVVVLLIVVLLFAVNVSKFNLDKGQSKF